MAMAMAITVFKAEITRSLKYAPNSITQIICFMYSAVEEKSAKIEPKYGTKPKKSKILKNPNPNPKKCQQKVVMSPKE